MDGMGIWQHTHTVTTTEISPDMGEFSEILDDVNVETIPLHYCWGCRTFKTASYIYVIHIPVDVTDNASRIDDVSRGSLSCYEILTNN
jgi:hypothetical protein